MGARSSHGILSQADYPLLSWAQNASSKITPAPVSYGLTAGIATTLSNAVTGFASALAACDPSTRNKTAVIAKNAAKDVLLVICRQVIKLSEGAPSVNDAKRSEIGIPPRKTPTPIPAPDFAPNVDILSVIGRTVLIRLHGDDENRRGLPAGCAGAQIYSYMGATPPEDLELWRFEGATTSVQKIPVDFPLSVAAGTQVWFKACWTSPRNQCGPASAAIPTHLQYGSVSLAA